MFIDHDNKIINNVLIPALRALTPHLDMHGIMGLGVLGRDTDFLPNPSAKSFAWRLFISWIRIDQKLRNKREEEERKRKE